MSGIDKVKTGIEIVGEVIRLAGDEPNVKASAGELGKTALTLTKTINNALLPLAAVNFAFDKARKYFAEQFEKDIKEKADKIPPESLVEPKASVAGPALQALAFAHEEPTLRDMFLELLAGSMDKNREKLAHPAFVEILKQLESEEARLIKSILPSDILPIASIARVHKNNGGKVVLVRHILDMRNQATKAPAIIENLSTMIDNWIRLGLIVVDYQSHLTEESRYSWLSDRPEMTARTSEPDESEFKLDWVKGIMFPTDLGKQFAKAVAIIK